MRLQQEVTSRHWQDSWLCHFVWLLGRSSIRKFQLLILMVRIMFVLTA